MDIDDGIFGNFFNKTRKSIGYQIRTYNHSLMNICQEYKNLFINDINMLQSRYGSSYAFDPKFYINASMVYSIDFIPVVAKNSLDIISAISGTFKKCVILD